MVDIGVDGLSHLEEGPACKEDEGHCDDGDEEVNRWVSGDALCHNCFLKLDLCVGRALRSLVDASRAFVRLRASVEP